MVTPPRLLDQQPILSSPKKRKANSNLRSETSAFEPLAKMQRQQHRLPLPHHPLANPALINPMLLPPQPPQNEFVYSDLMKRMAAKYQQQEERSSPPPPLPSLANPLGLPPYFAHFLPRYPAVSLPPPKSDEDASLSGRSSSSPESAAAALNTSGGSGSALDLSASAATSSSGLETWTVEQVVEFVKNVEGCEEHAEVSCQNRPDGRRGPFVPLVTPLPRRARRRSRDLKIRGRAG